MLRRATTIGACALLSLTLVSCVPEGPPTADAGPAQPARPATPRPQTKAPSVPLVPPGPLIMAPFEDTFDRAALGEDWNALSPGWHIENGRLCGKSAKNRGIWLRRRLPVNARIEFDAYAENAIGDIKVELWGDGQSGATTTSYTNATSYIAIFGGWRNSKHVLARLDEHGDDRLEIDVDPKSDDERERPVSAGQAYRFRVERADGKTIVWSINGVEYFTLTDPEPLAGPGHEHVGFNDWEVPVCFDNLKVTPL
ncbi:MAG TPA: hypothetical protein VM694_30815 [Polyangium sp.]|nr:hypothetical protein [Polyangium sp.]